MCAMQSNPQTPAAVSVVMPVFNECGTLETVLLAVLNQPCVAELIAVDDHSTDGSIELLERLAKQEARIKVLRHERNQGKGAALRTGISKASADIVLIQDADLEYDPADYAALLKPILSGKADAVFGSRFIGSNEHRVLYFWHSLGNRILTRKIVSASSRGSLPRLPVQARESTRQPSPTTVALMHKERR